VQGFTIHTHLFCASAALLTDVTRPHRARNQVLPSSFTRSTLTLGLPVPRLTKI
jgi:hypothetical protein